jgi:hypothetical protein
LEQGPTESFIVDQALKNRQPIPKRIQEAPVLMPGLEFYYETFWTLSTTRYVGMGESFIPWTAVNDFSLRYALTEDELDVLWNLLRKMDGTYLAFRNKKTEMGGKIGEKDKPKEPAIIHTGRPGAGSNKRTVKT